ncbi:MAG TPA: efflux RND transporter periplasmic adaptor subunit [Kofleriaceae bacterium]|nr:efflux RND transporter periplasmic adaptor subunit [Kofleriaceae bacterium]
MSSDQLSSDLASLRIDRTSPQRERPPRHFPSWLVWIAVGAIACVIVYLVAAPRLKSALGLDTKVRTGEITLVSPAQSQVQLTATGYVVPLVYAKVAAKVNGRIAELYVDEGDKVEKGMRVARLEDVDFKAQLAAAQAAAATARARVQTARAAMTEVKVQLDREKQLVAGGVSARATVEDLETRYASLAAQEKAAEADAAAADANVHTLTVQLDNYNVVSPIAGTVVDKIVEVGEVVAPGFGSPGVVEVVDLDSLVVEIDVPETRLSQVKVDGPCEIVLDAYPSQRYRGKVKEIGRRVDRSKATVPIKVSFVDHPAEALPDMAARVSFLSAELDEKDLKQPPKLIVPTEAVVQRDGQTVVFVVDDDTARRTPVQVGGPFSGGLELITPLPVGAKVVLAPPASLHDGDSVKEKN